MWVAAAAGGRLSTALLFRAALRWRAPSCLPFLAAPLTARSRPLLLALLQQGRQQQHILPRLAAQLPGLAGSHGRRRWPAALHAAHDRAQVRALQGRRAGCWARCAWNNRVESMPGSSAACRQQLASWHTHPGAHLCSAPPWLHPACLPAYLPTSLPLQALPQGAAAHHLDPRWRGAVARPRGGGTRLDRVLAVPGLQPAQARRRRPVHRLQQRTHRAGGWVGGWVGGQGVGRAVVGLRVGLSC